MTCTKHSETSAAYAGDGAQHGVRGYGSATLAATGFLAISAARAQAVWLTDPPSHITVYLGVWVSTAIVSAALIAVQTVTRTHRMHSGVADEMIRAIPLALSSREARDLRFSQPQANFQWKRHIPVDILPIRGPRYM